MPKVQKLIMSTALSKIAPKVQSQMFRKRLIDSGLIASGWLSRIPHPNGKDLKITVGEVWDLHVRDHLPTVTESTRVNKIFRCSKFLPPLFDIRICEMTPQVVTELVRLNLEDARAHPSHRRWNFRKELKDLRSVLQWHIDTVDFQCANPVKQHHYKLAVVREIPRRERQISIEQFQRFLSHLPEFYQKLCTAQFFGSLPRGRDCGFAVEECEF